MPSDDQAGTRAFGTVVILAGFFGACYLGAIVAHWAVRLALAGWAAGS